MNNAFRRQLAFFITFLSALFTFTFPFTGSADSDNDHLSRAVNLLRKRQSLEAMNMALSAPASGQRSLIAAVAAFRAGRFEDSLPLFADAERSYPILSDYAALYRAEALFRLKRYKDLLAVANSAAVKSSGSTAVVRRVEKLSADALFESGNLKGALNAYQAFVLRHAVGRDSVDARYQSARCRELTGDRSGAVAEYRAIWLQFPASPQADRIRDHLKALEKTGNSSANSFNPEELLKRAELLMAAGRNADAGWALAAISRSNLSDDMLSRIELKSGQAAIKQRQYTLAEKFLARAAGARNQQVKDEARLALARIETRSGKSDRAMSRLLLLASERGPLADDALFEAGLIHKNAGRYVECSKVLERLLQDFPASELLSRATWEMSWSRYLAGDFAGADAGFRRLVKDEAFRERGLYWLARALERQKKGVDAERQFSALMTAYPFGYYAALRREQKQQAIALEPYSQALPLPPFPPESEKIQALAACGMDEEARTEIYSLKGRLKDKPQFIPGIARLQELAGDYHGSINSFKQGKPQLADRSNLQYWAIGYPRYHKDLFTRNASANGLSEALALSLTRAESSFRSDVKSPAGAIGLMQLMPATAKITARYKGKAPFNPLWLTDPEYNIRIGTRHLRELMENYQQNTVYALAAYNAGSGALNRWRTSFGHLSRDEFVENIPYLETRGYVKKIITDIAIYRSLYRIQ